MPNLFPTMHPSLKNIPIKFFFFFLYAFFSLYSKAQHPFQKSRITPQNYFYKFGPIFKTLKKSFKENPDNIILAIEKVCNCESDTISKELCLYNKFVFTDFVLYLEQTKKLKKIFLAPDDSIKLLFSETRDYYFEQWLKQISFQKKNGFHEYENENLKNLTVEELTSKKSEKFSQLNSLVNIMNISPPKKTKNEYKRARRDVYDLLKAKTPFNAVMSAEAYLLSQNNSIQESLKCLKNKWELNKCLSLIDELKSCLNNDSAKYIEILGVLASQRHYFLRDLKGWMEQNHSESEFNDMLFVLKTSSLLYFKIETIGYLRGHKNFYPREIENQYLMRKPYHFWSVAYITKYLKEKGYSDAVVEKEAVFYARKYKRMIAFPGLAYNIWFRLPLRSGTVGDRKNVFQLQKEAVNWQLYIKKG